MMSQRICGLKALVTICGCLLLGLVLVPKTTNAEGKINITGSAYVQDGDSLIINNQKIRLEGIDATELYQECYINRKPYGCGLEAKEKIQSITQKKTVECHADKKDKYGRLRAHCYVGGRNINALMVRSGHALAATRFSMRYANEEKLARSEKLGIHAAKYTYPWQWRQQNKRRK